MALVKLDNSIISIRGKLGGVYYKTGPDGQHVQAMPRSIRYTRSPAQQGTWGLRHSFGSGGISGFSGLASLWALVLVASFALIWAAFAVAYIFYKVAKEKIKLTGYQWYIHFNLDTPPLERPPLWKPPPDPNTGPDYMVTFDGMSQYYKTVEEWYAYAPGGYYFLTGEHNGRPYYAADERYWFLWWSGTAWILSGGLDDEEPFYTYYAVGDDPVASYYNALHDVTADVYVGRLP